MNRNRKMTRNMAAAMAGMMLVNAGMGNVLAAEDGAAVKDEVGKEETVYVKMSPSGDTEEVIVSDWLKNEAGKDRMEDRTDLQEIENVKGEETFRQEGENLTWEADGNDIYYQGTTDRALPVSMKITYYLDGEEISPQELAGKSGHVRMVYEYTNHEKQGEIYTPFSLITGMVLPLENFSNVNVTNGKAISDGEKYIVLGIGLPGLSDSLKLEDLELLNELDLNLELPESFEVEADVTDFSLTMSMTVALPLDLSDLELDDIENENDLKEKLDELKDGAAQLIDGTGELADGVQTLKDSCVELIDGMNAVDENMGKLNDGIGTLNSKKGELTDGVDQLADGLNTLNGKKGELVGGINQLAAGIHSLNKSRPELMDGLQALVDGIEQIEGKEVKGKLKDGAASLNAGLKQFDAEGTQPLEEGSRQITAGLQALTADGAGSLKQGLADMEAGLSDPQMIQLIQGLNTYLDAVDQLADALAAGSSQGGMQKPGYISGAAQVAGGLQQVDHGLTELNNQVQGLMQQISGGSTVQADAASQTEGNALSRTVGQAEEAAVQPESETEIQTVTKEVNVSTEVSFAEANAEAVTSLQNAIAGNQAVLNSLYDVRAKKSSVPDELLKTYSGAYSTYSAQLDNCIAELEHDIASQQAALTALQTPQTVETVQEAEVEVEVPIRVRNTEEMKKPMTAELAPQGDGSNADSATVEVPVAQLQKIAETIQTLQENVSKLNAAAQGLTAAVPVTGADGKPIMGPDGSPMTVPLDQYLVGALTQLQSNNVVLKEGIQSLAGNMGILKSGVTTLENVLFGDGTAQNPGALNRLYAGSSSVSAGLTKLRNSLTVQLIPGSAALQAGISSLYSTGLDVMYTGMMKLNEKLPALNSGILQLDKGAKKLKKGGSELADGVEQLADGGNRLQDGAGTLADGVAELADGSVQLKDGTKELADGGQELWDGVGELNDGAIELRDGMEEFNEKAIEKIVDFADGDLQDMIDRLKAVQEAGEEYQLFSEGTDGSTGHVKFIMETGAIE